MDHTPNATEAALGSEFDDSNKKASDRFPDPYDTLALEWSSRDTRVLCMAYLAMVAILLISLGLLK